MDLVHTLVLLVAATVLYSAVVVFYRLLLHPLAKFPGPKLAAATGLYEAYYDLIRRPGGFFMYEVRKMHELYGKHCP